MSIPNKRDRNYQTSLLILLFNGCMVGIWPNAPINNNGFVKS